jgi:hypothetical protein
MELRDKSKTYRERLEIYRPIHRNRVQTLAKFDDPLIGSRSPHNFTISVVNEGPEGTVIVTEYENDNETVEVLRQMMSQGERINDVKCVGSGYKQFHWKNVASGNEGDADKADGLILHVDPQGVKKRV